MLSLQCLLVSTVFGTMSSLHPTSFLYLFLSRLSLDCSARRDDITGAKRVRARVGIAYTYVRACVLCAGANKTEVVTFMCNQDKMASV